MNAAATTLRPLTPAETRAVQLHAEGVALTVITNQTRLTADQVAVALARQAEWDALRNGTAKRGPNKMPRKPGLPPVAPNPEPAADDWDEGLPRSADTPEPDPTPPPAPAEDAPAAHDDAPEIAIEPKSVDWDTELPDTPGEGLVPAEPEPTVTPEPVVAKDELETLLEEADRSPQPRAKQLAAQIRDSTAELRQLLGNDEKVRVLFAAREVLARKLAQTEAELAELLDAGGFGYAAVNTAEPEPDVPVDEPAPLDGWTLGDAEALAVSPIVRQWGNNNGWTVGVRGRIAGAVVQAYMKAHRKGDQS
jgi:hypothetical protein